MIDNRQCEQWHREKGINVIIYDEMVCAGYFHGGKVSQSSETGDRSVIPSFRTRVKVTPVGP